MPAALSSGASSRRVREKLIWIVSEVWRRDAVEGVHDAVAQTMSAIRATSVDEESPRSKSVETLDEQIVPLERSETLAQTRLKLSALQTSRDEVIQERLLQNPGRQGSPRAPAGVDEKSRIGGDVLDKGGVGGREHRQRIGGARLIHGAQ